MITFNVDEYYPMDPEIIHSYYRYMWENLFEYINIKPDNVHVPDGMVSRQDVVEVCGAYEAKIAAAGGFDFQLLMMAAIQWP